MSAAPMRVAPAAGAWSDCRLCGCKLMIGTAQHATGDDAARGLCRDCLSRPEARRFGVTAPGPRPAPAPTVKARGFNPAEKALIRSMHGHMPASQLLDILNTRLVADLGAAAVLFTLAQLQEEVAKHVEASAGDGDWASLRKVLARARTSGLLATLTPQMVDDFSVIWQLSPAQHMKLRDVIRSAQEGR